MWTRGRTLGIATFFAGLVLISLLVAMPSASAPLRVETLALEPTLGTIPPLTYRAWMPIVAGECGGGECGE